MPRITKRDIYREYGIEYFKAGKNAWHINTPIGHIPPVLVDGNDKIGKGVFHFSTLPGDLIYCVTLANGETVEMRGTCAGTCAGGYCVNGHYKRRQSVKNSLANKTELAREHMDFLKRAILAQIKADNIKFVRIHVTGDFFSRAYLNTWIEIIKANPDTTFWTYTKETAAENAFDSLPNANIVKSNIPEIGYNFGRAKYIIDIYNFLKGIGKPVYICRCGMDPNQHCTNCKGCAKSEYVLFLEHGTDYNAAVDPDFPALCKLIESQGNIYLD